MQATNATFLAFPALQSLIYNSLITGLNLVATRADIYSAVLTWGRPPQGLHLPRLVPLS